MRKVGLIIILFCFWGAISAQYTFKAKVTDNIEFKPLPGAKAYIKNEIRGIADENGLITVTSIPEGEFEITFGIDGYFVKSVTYYFPLPDPDFTHRIELEPVEIKPVEEIATITRSNTPVDETPTRVEILNSEYLARQSHLSKGDLQSVLKHETGIQIQQTSVTSNSASIRIHGLNGRYTQVLRDGFPLYSGFAGELSSLQITSLDLHQIEIIKGSASALYGDGSVSGLVNLVSRTPEDKKLNILMKGSSSLGLDVSAYYAQKFRKIGATLFASRNGNWAYDPANIGFSAVPEVERYTFNPGLFFYLSDKTQLNVSLNSMFEDRLGGDTKYLRGEGDEKHSFYEKNVSDRVSSQIELKHRLNDKSHISLKNSLGLFKRRIDWKDYKFSGMQFNSYSEAFWQHQSEKLEWTLGASAYTDKFTEDKQDSAFVRNYLNYTCGVFAQNVWKTSNWLSLETAMRVEYNDDYGFVPLPRLSALFYITPKVSARLSGGLGYRSPSIFTYEAELLRYKDVRPIDVNKVDIERSVSGSFDITYKTPLFNNEGNIRFNQLVFYTRVNHPVELNEQADGTYEYVNEEGYYDSKGTETNIHLKYKELSFKIGYTLAFARQHFNRTTEHIPLSPTNRMTGTVIYEIKRDLRIGFEAMYTGKQYLYDQTSVTDYWILSLMAEKMWNHFSIFVNVENMLNVRQTKYEKIYTGTISDPVFNTIYTPIEGVVANFGIKVML